MTTDLSSLPAPSDRRVAVRVTPDALRQIRGGHPWVYDRSVTSTSHDGEAGDLAVVFDDRRRFAAIGLWDPGSPIRMKVLHTGDPRPIDGDFWRTRLGAAIERRRVLIDSPDTDGYRLVHGENDGLPGFVVDRYADIVVVKLYTAAWIPHLAALTDALGDLLSPASIVLRMARNVAGGPTHGLVEGASIAGAPADEIAMFVENGLRFEAHPRVGQKTGHFLDQRDNRALVRDHCDGARVLDMFSCTGGFSVHAAAGGARSVLGVDLSAPAVATARRNARHNDSNESVANCRFEGRVGDAFSVLADLAESADRFDVVIVDPPSFAQRQSSVAGALRSYSRLTALALQITEPGGLLVQASCSSRVDADTFHRIVHDTAADHGVELEVIERTAHPVDHPVGFPEGAYLKALFARVWR